jgi:hypothetical protein
MQTDFAENLLFENIKNQLEWLFYGFKSFDCTSAIKFE